MKDIYKRMNLLARWDPALWQGRPILWTGEYTAELLEFDGPTPEQHGFLYRTGII